MYFKNRQGKEERLEPEHSIRFQVLGWIRIFIAGSGFFIKPNMNPKHFPVFNPSADLFYLDFCLMSFFIGGPTSEIFTVSFTTASTSDLNGDPSKC